MFKFIQKQLKNKKGFTLVELVVVIAILGILAAIAVPKFTRTQVKAAENSHAANVRTLKSVANMYLADKQLPSSKITWNGTTDGATNEWEDYLQEWPKTSLKIDTIDKGSNYIVEIDTDGTITVTPDSIPEADDL